MTPIRTVARLIATAFGCGFWPWAPGTVGSLFAVAVAVLFGWQPITAAVAAAIMLGPSVWAAGIEEQTSGREDPGHVVVDEVVGQWITMAGAPLLNWKTLLAAFLLFRVLDVWKPAPARQLEGLHGGVGIMADDVMAGIYGALVLAAAGWLNLF
ncbi:MAG TPA: phosphatidylglycerophosphatase A [Bryobacteraceae bacterium]|nr:phosphatidylglycerophosphatase A [Bryobacteraceae bacterium]